MHCNLPPERFFSAPVPSSQKSTQREIRPSDDILYVNPDCALQILIDYIKLELHVEPNAEIDFCNLNGDLLHIEDSEPAANATNLFKPYMKYICVIKYKNDEGILAKLTPLVAHSYSEISLKLRKHVNMSRKLSYELKLRTEKESDDNFIPSTCHNNSTSTLRLKKRVRTSIPTKKSIT